MHIEHWFWKKTFTNWKSMTELWHVDFGILMRSNNTHSVQLWCTGPLTWHTHCSQSVMLEDLCKIIEPNLCFSSSGRISKVGPISNMTDISDITLVNSCPASSHVKRCMRPLIDWGEKWTTSSHYIEKIYSGGSSAISMLARSSLHRAAASFRYVRPSAVSFSSIAPGISTILSPEETAIRDSAAKFARDILAPNAQRMDREMKIDPSVLKAMFRTSRVPGGST